MKIQAIETFKITVPLKKPFKTALRTLAVAQSVGVKMTTEDGKTGYGEAPPTHVITGDSLASIEAAINEVMAPVLLNESLLERENLLFRLNKSMVNNTSAKAALDCAIHDLLAQYAGMPLVHFLGGSKTEFLTDYTVSVNEPEEMAGDAHQFVQDGFSILKIKVGTGTIQQDLDRIKAIREKAGYGCRLRLDANQGWTAKEAIYAIRKMEDAGMDIELVEQPVKAHDIQGLKQVTDHTSTPIMADESVFSPQDAIQVLQTRSADLLNIKLMKAGGIHQALTINKLAEAYGVPCMVGSMIETKIGITAAAHFAASQHNITHFDFDAPLLLAKDIVSGGVEYRGEKMHLSEAPGLGITGITN
ncbi:mandelate racemase/muconate lactonizing enzyme family protein [Jeotgalibacillus proteolyticus]|uniref:Dipeptide epimerase n=1 Tax=Jeotgalibacillus proteolyticus TaxID=2082395 RepID=A0A2S5GA76_9BACL|nr:dipeptide epimerase [Jeotgalibacillus proteolyticus]PPA69825.1 dipeptide epimerase [Jeotgalibacillus proteolyticus]